MPVAVSVADLLSGTRISFISAILIWISLHGLVARLERQNSRGHHLLIAGPMVAALGLAAALTFGGDDH
ncbi:MAG: hypothetical protein HC844_20485 [Tabrizicola sp.]|nr:hypothetical protein [Tabrizicola sp.]